MARALRISFPGAIYHISNRMVGSWRDERARLFRGEQDYLRFLDRMREHVKEMNVRLYLYSLMANHFHLVLETPEGNLSAFMHKLSTAYTVYYNRCHQRHGHLLDGRFTAKLVEGDKYLMKLSRYVHLNPVRVSEWENRLAEDRVAYLRAYKWSSYRLYIGLSKEFSFVDTAPILAQQGGDKAGRSRRYREYVEADMGEKDLELEEALNASSLGIGDEAFQRWVQTIHTGLAGGHRRPEDVTFRRIANPLQAQEVLPVLATALEVEITAFRERRRNSCLRAIAARFLIRYAGQSQRDVAEILGMKTGAAVSLQVKRYEALVKNDRRLRSLTTKVEHRLEAIQEEKKSANSNARETGP